MQIKTFLCHEINEDIQSISLEAVDLPSPGPGQLQVRLYACSVNFPDILMIQGKYQFKPPLPFAPGGEAAGEVTAMGADVTDYKVGDRVVVGLRYGGFAEAVNVDAAQAELIPGSLSYEKAASYKTAYLTAWVALTCRGHLEPGENLLVHGATGGVGMAAVDLGKHLGANVIATGGRDDKLAVVASLGADHVINYTLPDGGMGGFRDKVKALSDGRGADVIYEPVGGDVFDESMRCVAIDGRILVIGFTSGRWPQAPVNLILIKQVSVIGVRAGEYGRTYPERGIENRRAIMALANNGDISPYVSHALPLEEAVAAMQVLESRNVIGKCIVTMNGYTHES